MVCGGRGDDGTLLFILLPYVPACGMRSVSGNIHNANSGQESPLLLEWLNGTLGICLMS